MEEGMGMVMRIGVGMGMAGIASLFYRKEKRAQGPREK
jgi:hypothetical protein